MGKQPEDQQNRTELLELYRLALEDYRFQVQLNWGRSQYFLVLNLSLIGIATGILQFADGKFGILVTGLYLIGAVFCIFSIAALQFQRKFYRSARVQKEWFEDQLQLGAASITPVEHAGSKVSKIMTFKAFVNFMFVALAILNLGFALFVFMQS